MSSDPVGFLVYGEYIPAAVFRKHLPIAAPTDAVVPLWDRCPLDELRARVAALRVHDDRFTSGQAWNQAMDAVLELIDGGTP